MKSETEFILQCKPNSFIEQVMFSKDSLETSVLLNQPLLFCLAPESLEAGKRFLDDIRHLGKAEGYELELLLKEEKSGFLFSGMQLNGHLIIVAQHSNNQDVSETTENLISEEIESSLETTPDQLREFPLDTKSEITVWDLMEEMSRLNNELINTKRELTRKNIELERLQKLLKKG